ncbi:MAG TPA: hypothetical protein DCS93_22005 [Microscillaceae bacterium]|nr:hypothetical protein [Microscillaceae bacterium]
MKKKSRMTVLRGLICLNVVIKTFFLIKNKAWCFSLSIIDKSRGGPDTKKGQNRTVLGQNKRKDLCRAVGRVLTANFSQNV